MTLELHMQCLKLESQLARSEVVDEWETSEGIDGFDPEQTPLKWSRKPGIPNY